MKKTGKKPAARQPHARASKALRGLLVAIDSVQPDPQNARKRTPENLAAIRASLETFGFQRPILAYRFAAKEKPTVISGNGALQAATELGWDRVPVLLFDGTRDQARAYAIADNRTAELSEWDEAILGAQTSVLDEFEDLWRALKIEELLPPDADDAEEDEIPEPPKTPITKAGDVWILGDHRLCCGDSTKPADVKRLVGSERPGILFTSPPYLQQRKYGTAESLLGDWDGLMAGVFDAALVADDAQLLVNLGLIHKGGEVVRYWDPWLADMKKRGWKLFGWYVWDKIQATFKANDGRPYMAHEWVFHLNRTSRKAVAWVECQHAGMPRPQHGQRNAAGVVRKLSTPGPISSHKPPSTVASISRETSNADADVRSHPARFPVKFAEYWIRTWTGDVYEPFAGSGSTLIACEQLGRKCYAMEIDPRYCDVIVHRWEKLTGRKAERA